MEIYLIRHTTPQLTQGLIYGQMEVELAETYEEELAVIRTRLPDQFDAVYSSPSSRCMKLADSLGGNIHMDFRLMELNFGEWEGMTWDTVNQDDLNKWMDDFVHEAVPGGESMLQMNERVLDFWQELISRQTGKVALVTHGGVIRLLLAHVGKMELSSIFNIKVEYGEVIELSRNQSLGTQE